MRLPATLKRIGHSTFCRCGNLRCISLPQGLENIGRRCFSGTSIEEIVLPNSVTTICDEAFSECRQLRAVSLQAESRLQKIGRACFCRSGIREFLAPQNLTEIGQDAFAHCSVLKLVALGRGQRKLGDVFRDSGLEELRLPRTLKEVNQLAFADCSCLRLVCAEDDCGICFSETGIPAFARVGPPPETAVGGARV